MDSVFRMDGMGNFLREDGVIDGLSLKERELWPVFRSDIESAEKSEEMKRKQRMGYVKPCERVGRYGCENKKTDIVHYGSTWPDKKKEWANKVCCGENSGCRMNVKMNFLKNNEKCLGNRSWTLKDGLGKDLQGISSPIDISDQFGKFDMLDASDKDAHTCVSSLAMNSKYEAYKKASRSRKTIVCNSNSWMDSNNTLLCNTKGYLRVGVMFVEGSVPPTGDEHLEIRLRKLFSGEEIPSAIMKRFNLNSNRWGCEGETLKLRFDKLAGSCKGSVLRWWKDSMKKTMYFENKTMNEFDRLNKFIVLRTELHRNLNLIRELPDNRFYEEAQRGLSNFEDTFLRIWNGFKHMLLTEYNEEQVWNELKRELDILST